MATTGSGVRFYPEGDLDNNNSPCTTTDRMLTHAHSSGDKSTSSHHSLGGACIAENSSRTSNTTGTYEEDDNLPKQQHFKSDRARDNGDSHRRQQHDDDDAGSGQQEGTVPMATTSIIELDSVQQDNNKMSLDEDDLVCMEEERNAYTGEAAATSTCLPGAPEAFSVPEIHFLGVPSEQEEKAEEQDFASTTDCPSHDRMQRKPLHVDTSNNNDLACGEYDDDIENDTDPNYACQHAESFKLTPPSSMTTPLDDIFETLRQQQRARELGLPYKYDSSCSRQPAMRTRTMLEPPGASPPDASESFSNYHHLHPKYVHPSFVKMPSMGNHAQRRGVQFSYVHIREYDVTIGDNPCCSYGPPISLDWNYNQDTELVIDLDVFEAQNAQRKCPKTRNMIHRNLLLSYNERRAMLWKAGYSLEEIEEASKAMDKERWRRSMLGNLEPLYRLEEVFWFFVLPFCSRKSQFDLARELEHLEEKVREEHSVHSQVTIPTEILSPITRSSLKDLKVWNKGSVVIEGIESIHDSSSSASRHGQDAGGGSGEGRSSQSSTGSDPPFEYSVRVDRSQHNKSMEIILCNFQRPHMRAFHGAWFSFFMAFFSWFAITPLLVEVKHTLNLDKHDIWTSSLFGTAGSIVMRILLGPACDKWGARLCMAFILMIAAVPTSLTGLVNTSAGLSVLRFFIGLAGGSFVACQYWTSAMFTREVAGTANAMVAGWGNLGGGVTNVVMGSVLFPLFEWCFRGQEGESMPAAELAWRTVFIVPGVLTFITALLILIYCDDSPKGSYRELMRREKMMRINPVDSLKASAKNVNVWILALQYACCFGVEVTMTNATALYYADKFGQSTASAAGLASLFGFMNLFARGLGGLGSDLFQNKYGAKGRIAWQLITLFLEGISIVIFGYAESLGASIVALVFCSIMVQCAEGSTFGIVPYVERRFTGSVVGIVGAGGNIGGVIFSVYFRQFSYRMAFRLMGGSAVLSSFLSICINRRSLALTYAAAALEQQQQQERQQQREAGKRHQSERSQRQNDDPGTKLFENTEEPWRQGVMTGTLP